MEISENDFDRLVTHVEVYDSVWFFEDYNEGSDPTEDKTYPYRYVNQLDESYSSVLFARQFLEARGHPYVAVWDADDANWCILSDYAPKQWRTAVERSKLWNDQLALQNLQPRTLDKPYDPALGWNQQPSE